MSQVQHIDLEPLVSMTPQQISALFVTAILQEQRAFTKMVTLQKEQIRQLLDSSASIEQWVELQQEVKATLAQMLQAQQRFAHHLQQVGELIAVEEGATRP